MSGGGGGAPAAMLHSLTESGHAVLGEFGALVEGIVADARAQVDGAAAATLKKEAVMSKSARNTAALGAALADTVATVQGNLVLAAELPAVRAETDVLVMSALAPPMSQ